MHLRSGYRAKPGAFLAFLSDADVVGGLSLRAIMAHNYNITPESFARDRGSWLISRAFRSFVMVLCLRVMDGLIHEIHMHAMLECHTRTCEDNRGFRSQSNCAERCGMI